MTELEKIEYAKSFIDKLANGINPLDGMPIPEGDIANNVRLSRCFFYVSDILRQVIENGGVERKPQSTRPRKAEFSLSASARARILILDKPLTVSEIADNLNRNIDPERMKKITASAINNWLLSVGLLEVVMLANGKQRKQPSDRGNEMGIYVEGRNGQFGEYYVVLFSAQMQQFIYDNVDAIVTNRKK